MNERVLTVREAAERLRVTEESVRRWLRAGRLRGVMIGGQRSGYRIPESEVERLLSGGAEQGKARAAA
jgi:excisionase family DNA binding protein